MKHLAGKLAAAALIAGLLVLGLLGLLLPILPGLLFLGIAAVMATRHFPGLHGTLGRNRYAAEGMRMGNGLLRLQPWDKLRLCFWGTLKYTLDVVAWTAAMIQRQVKKLV